MISEKIKDTVILADKIEDVAVSLMVSNVSLLSAPEVNEVIDSLRDNTEDGLDALLDAMFEFYLAQNPEDTADGA